MKPSFPTLVTATILATLSLGSVHADENLQNEILAALDRGTAWYEKDQDAETGAWGDTNQPAISAIALDAIMGHPSRSPNDAIPAWAKKGYDFLISKTKADGGIYGKGLASYNTSLALMALLHNPDPSLMQAKLNARRFLINQQSAFDIRGETDNQFDGGVGYGGTDAHSALSNTHFVIQALKQSQAIVAESGSEKDKKMDLDWDAAITFVSRCQNLPATSGDWASDDPDNKGGFVYFPGNTKAGIQELDNGKVALRSYGSISYAGLLSFIYAEMDKEDPRVVAVLEWLSNNYTLDENPGMKLEGLYYYYHTMAKALSAAGVTELKLADGSKVDWRKALAERLLKLQQEDGSWVNTDARWWENEPQLVTGYVMLSLQHLYHSLD